MASTISARTALSKPNVMFVAKKIMPRRPALSTADFQFH